MQPTTVFRLSILSVLLGTLVACGGGGGSTSASGNTPPGGVATTNSFALPGAINTTGQ